MSASPDAPLEELVANRIWTMRYPVHYAGLDFEADAKAVLRKAWARPLSFEE